MSMALKDYEVSFAITFTHKVKAYSATQAIIVASSWIPEGQIESVDVKGLESKER